MDRSWLIGEALTQKERRRARRRNLRIPSVIYDPKRRKGMPCTLVNLSDTGAGLHFDGKSDLPERFVLLIAGAAALRRVCTCVRRSGRNIGVRFQSCSECRE